MKNIINNKLFLIIVSLISIIVIFVMKFILISSYGFLELFLMLFCLIVLITNVIKKVNNKLLKIILVLIIIWFSLLAIDYKRHRNMYQPLFVIKNENRDFIGIGYRIEKEYNQEGDHVYQSNDKFYLFGILIDDVKATTDNNANEQSLDNISYKNPKSNISLLRAGGGSSSSGGGSSGGSSGGHTTGSNVSNRPTSIIGTILHHIIFSILFFFTAIVFYLKIIRASINSKRLLKLLDDKDKSWNYRNIEQQVINAFYSIQESWTNMDMSTSKEYMDDDLYETFNTKLEWMQMGNKRNVLKKIKLVNLKPISIYDDEDDSKDLIWFYIKGKMIDYTINTETNEKIEGNDYSKSFVEFWKFVKRDDKWVLAKILQKNEENLIKFQDN